MAIPETLQTKIDLFRSTGRIFREHEELFIEIGWFQVLTGQNIEPETYHPLADAISSDQLKQFLSDLKSIIGNAATRLPSHEQFISANCAAGPVSVQRVPS